MGTIRSFALLAVFGLVVGVVVGQEPKPVNSPPPPPGTKAIQAQENSASVGHQQRGLTYVQRRELGMTFGNCSLVVSELRQDGKVSDATSDSEVAALVLAKIRRTNRKAFDAGGYDWEACLAFVEIWYSEIRGADNEK